MKSSGVASRNMITTPNPTPHKIAIPFFTLSANWIVPSGLPKNEKHNREYRRQDYGKRQAVRALLKRSCCPCAPRYGKNPIPVNS